MKHLSREELGRVLSGRVQATDAVLDYAEDVQRVASQLAPSEQDGIGSWVVDVNRICQDRHRTAESRHGISKRLAREVRRTVPRALIA